MGTWPGRFDRSNTHVRENAKNSFSASRALIGIVLEGHVPDLASSIANSLVAALPTDGSEVSWAEDGVRVAVYRCSRRKSTHKGFRGEAEAVLTGGVQIIAMTDLPQYGPRTVFTSRLRPPWTPQSLERRIVTVVENVRSRRTLDVARDLVHQRTALVRHSPYFEREWLRHARSTGLPLLIDVDDMTLAQAEAWLEWLSLRA